MLLVLVYFCMADKLLCFDMRNANVRTNGFISCIVKHETTTGCREKDMHKRGRNKT